MIATNERLARVEGQIQEHYNMYAELSERLGRFEQRVDVRFDEMDRKLDRKVEELDRKIDRRFGELDQKLDRSFDRLDTKMTRQFTWLVGLIVTSMLAIGVSALAP